ncbi:DUF4129 domain-containing protein [Actinacidiphila reveromycinica]|uniref:DUF4129 domain-containing protein n=1 Tax=Actinacidiphila reveromycinica TaxID=659352 RepID=UPI001F34C6EE|nr:DUF4129 domain-containing protein [Streptomyces sp. SN-593]
MARSNGRNPGTAARTTGWGGGRAALAVLVVAGTGAAALLLRPDGGVGAQGRGPLGGDGTAFGVAALWLVASIAAHRRYRDRLARYDERRTAAQQRLADVARRALTVAPVAVPVLLLALHDFHGRPAPRPAPTPQPPAGTVNDASPPPAHRHTGDSGPHLPGWLPHLVVGLLIAAAAVAVTLAAITLLRMLRRPERPLPEGLFRVIDDEEEVLAEAVRSGRRALRDTGDARAAVIACYAAMETSLAASGVARHASDSPQDLLERAAAGDLLSGPAAGELTDLFREARYSTHAMDDRHRRRAADALARIAAQLERRAAEGAGSAAAAGSAS